MASTGINKGTLQLKLHGKKLANVDLFGKSDLFFEICTIRSGSLGESWGVVYKSEHIQNTAKPLWKETSLELDALCRGDFSQPIKIIIYDQSRKKKCIPLGSFETTTCGLLDAAVDKSPFNLNKGKIYVIKAIIMPPNLAFAAVYSKSPASLTPTSLSSPLDNDSGIKHNERNEEITEKEAENEMKSSTRSRGRRTITRRLTSLFSGESNSTCEKVAENEANSSTRGISRSPLSGGVTTATRNLFAYSFAGDNIDNDEKEAENEVNNSIRSSGRRLISRRATAATRDLSFLFSKEGDESSHSSDASEFCSSDNSDDSDDSNDNENEVENRMNNSIRGRGRILRKDSTATRDLSSFLTEDSDGNESKSREKDMEKKKIPITGWNIIKRNVTHRRYAKNMLMKLWDTSLDGEDWEEEEEEEDPDLIGFDPRSLLLPLRNTKSNDMSSLHLSIQVRQALINKIPKKSKVSVNDGNRVKFVDVTDDNTPLKYGDSSSKVNMSESLSKYCKMILSHDQCDIESIRQSMENDNLRSDYILVFCELYGAMETKMRTLKEMRSEEVLTVSGPEDGHLDQPTEPGSAHEKEIPIRATIEKVACTTTDGDVEEMFVPQHPHNKVVVEVTKDAYFPLNGKTTTGTRDLSFLLAKESDENSYSKKSTSFFSGEIGDINEKEAGNEFKNSIRGRGRRPIARKVYNGHA